MRKKKYERHTNIAPHLYVSAMPLDVCGFPITLSCNFFKAGITNDQSFSVQKRFDCGKLWDGEDGLRTNQKRIIVGLKKIPGKSRKAVKEKRSPRSAIFFSYNFIAVIRKNTALFSRRRTVPGRAEK